jgi:hypothetical protein
MRNNPIRISMITGTNSEMSTRITTTTSSTILSTILKKPAVVAVETRRVVALAV